MSLRPVSDYLKFDYQALYPSLLFGPTIAMSLCDTAEIAIVTSAAGLVSNAVSHQIAKISLDKGWDDGSRIWAIFFSSLAIYSIAAIAMAIFNIPGALICLGVGTFVSISNSFFEDIAAKDTMKKINDYKKAHEEFDRYKRLCEQFNELAKAESVDAKNPFDQLKTKFNSPEYGSVLLLLITNAIEDVEKDIKFNLKLHIAKKIRRCDFLKEDLRQKGFNVDGLQNSKEIYAQCLKGDSDMKALNDTVDRFLASILARYEALNIQPA